MARRIILALLLSTAAAFAPAVKPRAATQLRAGGDGEITAVRACETVHQSNCLRHCYYHGIHAIDASHWLICAQVRDPRLAGQPDGRSGSRHEAGHVPSVRTERRFHWNL